MSPSFFSISEHLLTSTSLSASEFGSSVRKTVQKKKKLIKAQLIKLFKPPVAEGAGGGRTDKGTQSPSLFKGC